ncbi:phosphoadenosine phosphosulfate reductase family protein [uncultured Fusobacterium sp.]|uniref:phosphoadenosine phosphosulfate reductase domain-containing protein n=1 Tax=uncultured Fusobacterium sp. TaxID=159267 RepID=UPI0025D4A393|nr:phosphoadenosine phosphosulfate reductase family protein [uncultured Fusobacterium sp.]
MVRNALGIYWDQEKNIPIILDKNLDDIKIKKKKLIEVAQDLRPVFLEEKHLLRVLFNLEEDIYYKSVWCTKLGRYIVDGTPFRKSIIKKISEVEEFEVFRKRVLNFEKTDKMVEKEKEIFQNFIEENSEHMSMLLNSTERDDEGNFIGAYPFIEEVLKKYSTRIPMVSFSGGKDSTVVSHLVRKALNNQSILHIFGDTTLELPLTYKYVERFKEENPMTPFFDEKNEENNFFQMCKEIGPPSRVKSWCCSIFKTGPMGTTLTNFDEDFLTFYGVRRKESASRSKYLKVSKTPKIHGGIVASPVIDWFDLDIWLYILSEKIDFNDNYKLGFPRVGCWMCPNNSDISQFLAKIYVSRDEYGEINFDYKEWEEFLYDFSYKIVKEYHLENNIPLSQEELKEEVEKYVKNNKWKTRQGGAGLEKSKDLNFKQKECINEKNTYILNLNRDIDEEFITLFKPFGKISISNSGKSQEMYVLNREKEALFKILFKEKNREIKITLINLKDKYLYGKIIRQINKFNTCIYCQACNSTCSFGALSVINGKYTIDENKCVHCLNCVTKFDMGCLVASALRTKSKE